MTSSLHFKGSFGGRLVCHCMSLFIIDGIFEYDFVNIEPSFSLVE